MVYGYNTDVLGCVIERVAGQTLDRVIATRVTEPLGMTDTHFFVSPDQRDRLAAVYARSGADGRATGRRKVGGDKARPWTDRAARSPAAQDSSRRPAITVGSWR